MFGGGLWVVCHKRQEAWPVPAVVCCTICVVRWKEAWPVPPVVCCTICVVQWREAWNVIDFVCCTICEHAAGVVRGESGFDLFWGAAWVGTFGIVYPDGGAIQCLVDGNDLWEMGEGRGVYMYVLKVVFVVVCGEVGINEGVGEIASVDAKGVVIVVAFN